jgi:class 3 adenylate cyclase/tetratricopeptide (TPR) repeat protein
LKAWWIVLSSSNTVPAVGSDVGPSALEAVERPEPGSGQDLPEAYIAGDRRRALADGRSLPGRVSGAAIFADISGFTPFTEELAEELGSQRASEVLTGHLNRIFHAVIAELDSFGGEVIYFSGDAITCWLDGDDGARAVSCGFAMQEAIAREGRIATPGGKAFQLTLKVAVAVGDARRFVVGDPQIQLIDVLAGRLVDRIADAQQLAERGEVVVDESALDSLAGRIAVAEHRSGEDARIVGVVERLLVDVQRPPPAPTALGLPVELVRPWLLPAVYERLSTGRGEFLAELRPAFPLFLSFGGIDYDEDEAAAGKLDEFVRTAQRILTAHGGNVLQLTLGDKGAYLYGVFGTPVAHEDDAARAAAAALELRALEGVSAARDIRVGITRGRLRSGTYGHALRRTFVCLGDAVNLSARLMSKAPAGQIYVSELVRRAAGDSFEWTQLPPLRLAGKAAPIAAFQLTGGTGRRSRRAVRHKLPMVGRGAELHVLEAGLAAARSGHGRIVGLSAEAGMGKSRLVAEFVRRARAGGTTVAFGECQSFGNASYVVWQEITRALFGIDERLPELEQVRLLERAVWDVDPALIPRVPLLDAVLGLPIPESDLTSSFDAKLRKASLEDLFVECLRGRARSEPLVLVLEDCHWIDPLSRDLLDEVARSASSQPTLIVLSYRPDAASPEGLALSRLPHIEELQLAALDGRQMGRLVESKLDRLVGTNGDAPRAIVDLVVHRAQGNPFYAEELLNYLHDRGIDPADERALGALELPDSVHSLILSRVDALSEAPRRTLKVASVVGRSFHAHALPGVYPELGTPDDVRAHLETLRLLDLINLDREDDETYVFKHVVTQEVAYESIPFVQRASLHTSVGSYIELSEPDSIERNLDALAHHYWHSDNAAKRQTYLLRAGKAAQAGYANAAAIDYFERVVPLLDETERVAALLSLGEVLELVGNWQHAQTVDADALALAEELGDEHSQGWCEAALAEIARKQGRFDEASERLGHARAIFERLGEEDGLGRVLHVGGTVATQRGDFDGAREQYEASLQIRERVGDLKGMASVLSNLGIVAEYQEQYGRARAWHTRALALREELGDRWAIANSMTNLGMIAYLEGNHAEARSRFEEAMRLNREVGDTWMVALADNNLGNATRDLGDHTAARRHYAASLTAYRGYGDNWGMAFLLEDVARLAALLGEAEVALELVGAAATLRQEIGAPRTAALEEQLASATEDTAASLSAAQRGEALQRGHELTFAAAADRALGLCVPSE